jgi:rhamnose transport system permease protein
MTASQLPSNKNPHDAQTTIAWRERLRPYLPEIVVTLLLLLSFLVGSLLSPFFLDTQFLFKQAILYLEIGILALGLTVVIISGNLDLSVASNLAMVASVTAYLHAKQGVPFEWCLLFGLVLGSLGGALNGYLVAWLGLPSLTVTLATLALYRGVAQILLGDYSIQDMPAWFFGVDRFFIAGTPIPLEFVFLLLLAVLLGLLLHKTVFGRYVYALGTNERAAHFAGVPVRRVKLVFFTLAGFLAGLAALLLNSRLMVARYDHARGWELDAITAVVLGGTSIAGGRGTIYGTIVALFMIGVLRTAMGVANVKVEAQLTVVGALLIVAFILSDWAGRRRQRPKTES